MNKEVNKNLYEQDDASETPNVNEYFGGNTDSDVRTSSAGFRFNVTDDKWVLDSETNVLVTFVQMYPQEYRESIILTLAYYAEQLSAQYVRLHIRELRRFLKHSEDFTLNGLLAYKLSTPQHNRDQYLSVFRCFLRQMIYLGFDVPEVFMKEFNTWVLRGSEKGIPVLTQDPEEGPYSEIEYRAVKASLDYKYADDTISDREYSIAQLFMATFRRPTNLKQLKVKDLLASSNVLVTKQVIFQINIPRSKGKGRPFRSQFKAFALIESIGLVLTKHIQNSIKLVETRIKRKLTQEEVKELPIFYKKQMLDELDDYSPDQLMDYLKSEIPHVSSADLTKELQLAIGKLNIISERTGETLRTTAYRFRYSGGTRAAEAGAGMTTIAELLDHLDTQHTGVYVANSPELGHQISQIMNNPLARYASAFMGKVVADEDEAIKINPNATRIPCREKNCDVGSCGSSSFCTDFAPVACYLCPKFLPWENAPHHEVLQWLLEERERLSKTLNDHKVVEINDSAILAVAQVMKHCEEAK
jgi:integrase